MSSTDAVVIHADESCLGNQNTEAPRPGGAASLIEVRDRVGVARRDLFLSDPDTTNNRMALEGAVDALRALSRKGRRLQVVYVSDSNYLVRGMTEWIKSWEARGWRRKGGAVENVELWRTLLDVSRNHEVRWRWVKGHAGHPKNEYANDLAMKAARHQMTSAGPQESAFPEWLASRKAAGQFQDYDPDDDFYRVVGSLSRRTEV